MEINKTLIFNQGEPLGTFFEAVIGSDVAKSLGYKIGDSLTITHGVQEIAGMVHEGYFFIIKGILKSNGTPIDRSIHIPLEGIEAIHNSKGDTNYSPTSITSFLVGLKSRISIFRIKRGVELYREEALSAVLPGAALHQLWQTVGMVDSALKITTFFVLLIGMASIFGMLWTSLEYRRREMMIFRAMGAKTRHLFTLLYIETLSIMIVGALSGYALLQLLLKFAKDPMIKQFGLRFQPQWFSSYDDF